jgi:hypothetical protein
MLGMEVWRVARAGNGGLRVLAQCILMRRITCSRRHESSVPWPKSCLLFYERAGGGFAMESKRPSREEEGSMVLYEAVTGCKVNIVTQLLVINSSEHH